MKTLQKRARLVLDAIDQLIGDGASEVRPGDVTSLIRKKGQPLGAWEVRYEFSTLEAEGLITCDPDSGAWQRADGRGRKAG